MRGLACSQSSSPHRCPSHPTNKRISTVLLFLLHEHPFKIIIETYIEVQLKLVDARNESVLRKVVHLITEDLLLQRILRLELESSGWRDDFRSGGRSYGPFLIGNGWGGSL